MERSLCNLFKVNVFLQDRLLNRPFLVGQRYIDAIRTQRILPGESETMQYCAVKKENLIDGALSSSSRTADDSSGYCGTLLEACWLFVDVNQEP